MSHVTVQFFTGTEEMVVNLLIDNGMQKNIAAVLVFLAGIPEATSHAIERESDLRQPDVSLAMKYLKRTEMDQPRRISPANKGRPMNVYALAVPVAGILDCIGKEMNDEVNNQLALVKK